MAHYRSVQIGPNSVPSRPASLRGLGDGEGDPFTWDLSSIASQVGPGLMQLYQAGRTADVQDQLLALNIERAKRGQSPITLNQVGGAAMVGPQAGVTVGMSDDVKNTLMLGGAALLGVYLLKSRRSRR